MFYGLVLQLFLILQSGFLISRIILKLLLNMILNQQSFLKAGRFKALGS
jgi:hypothetical protein